MSDKFKPDWEGFGRDLLECWPVRDVDGLELFDAALRNGLIHEVPGGYDPEQHIDAEGIAPERGDPWYEYSFAHTRTDTIPSHDALIRAAVARVANLRPSKEQIASAALSYDHSFGLMKPADQENLMHRAGWWLNAWQHEIRALATDPEAIAAIIKAAEDTNG